MSYIHEYKFDGTIYYDNADIVAIYPAPYYQMKIKSTPKAITKKKNIPKHEYRYAYKSGLVDWVECSKETKLSHLFLTKAWVDVNMKFIECPVESVHFIGEDRTFGGNELFIDMIPMGCWFTNVRTCVDVNSWTKIRNEVYNRVNHKCECCDIDTKNPDNRVRIEAHERWEYNNDTHVQKLVRLVALCNLCHLSTHMGYAGVIGQTEVALEHLKRVRGITDEQLSEHRRSARLLWTERNNHKWTLDLTMIEQSGFILKNPNIRNRNDPVNNSNTTKVVPTCHLSLPIDTVGCAEVGQQTHPKERVRLNVHKPNNRGIASYAYGQSVYHQLVRYWNENEVGAKVTHLLDDRPENKVSPEAILRMAKWLVNDRPEKFRNPHMYKDLKMEDGLTPEIVREICNYKKLSCYILDENDTAFISHIVVKDNRYSPIVLYAINGHAYIVNDPVAIASINQPRRNLSAKIASKTTSCLLSEESDSEFDENLWLPSQISDFPWLYKNDKNARYNSVSPWRPKPVNIGKWMLYYDKSKLDDAWTLAKNLYDAQKLDGILSMKCSTFAPNPRASTTNKGVIILYCSDSSNEQKIMSIGEHILNMFNYNENPTIYYKTDLQTSNGTFATGSKCNHTYKLINPNFASFCRV